MKKKCQFHETYSTACYYSKEDYKIERIKINIRTNVIIIAINESNHFVSSFTDLRKKVVIILDSLYRKKKIRLLIFNEIEITSCSYSVQSPCLA